MSIETIQASQTAGSDGRIILGSFALLRRLPSDPGERPGYLVAEAVGQGGSPHAGRAAIARCAPLSPEDSPPDTHVQLLAGRLIQLAHPHLIPVLEAGALPAVTFAIEARPDGEPLSTRMTGASHPPAQVARWVSDIASALATVHAAELAHGRVTPATIWIDPRDRALLGGLVPALSPSAGTPQDPWQIPEGELDGPAGDQYQLAVTAAALLTGRLPDSTAPFAGQDHLPGVAERVAQVIKRGMAPQAEARFPSVVEFAEALATAVQQTGEDLIAGVWDALSRNDRAMASLMLDLAARSLPDHPDLPVLRIRLSGNPYVIDTGSLAPGAFGASSEQQVVTKGFEFTVTSDPGNLPASGRDYVANALLSPFAPQTSGKRPNPWMPLLAGLFGGICVLAVLLALVVGSS